MKLKNLWGLLAVLAVATFAFAACSDDDDDDKTGTYEYQVISSFDGDIESINKVNDAFQQAFGAESAPFTLTGTKSECNRKAKEYAMKAQAALANDGSFAAEVKLINVTTDELIHSFDIQKDENALPRPGATANTLHYVLDGSGIYVFGIQGNRVRIERHDRKWVAFDGVIEANTQKIKLNNIPASNGQSGTGSYDFIMWEGTSEKIISKFLFNFNGKYKVGDALVH